MKQNRHMLLIVLFIGMSAVTGAAVILTIPSLFRSQDESQMWITVALGCATIALALAAGHERRRHPSSNE